MASDPPVNVFVGCPQLLGRLPDGPCLIVDADASFAERIHRQASVTMHDWPVSVVTAVLTAVPRESVEWHRFSDQRFNGPWTADEWCAESDNLDHIGSEECVSVTLKSVLEKCNFLANIADACGLNIYLSQGNPLQVLDGCESLLTYVKHVFFRYPRRLPIRAENLSCEMTSRSFSLSDDDSQTWLFNQSLFVESRLKDALRSLFDLDLCRKLRVDLSALSDDDLLAHFIFSNDTLSIAKLFRDHYKSVDNDLAASFSSLVHCFPFSAYRAARPDLDHLSDSDLCRHYMRHAEADQIDLRHRSLVELRLSELRAQCDHLQSLLDLCTHDFQDLQALTFKDRLLDAQSQ